MRALAVALVLGVVLGIAAPASARSFDWKITKDRWTEVDETGFSNFVQAIGESDCRTPNDCIRSAANPYRDSDPPGLNFDADCADLIYLLRAYYAWKNGLPFTFANGVRAQEGGDLRFNQGGNVIVSRRDVLLRGGSISAQAIFHEIRNVVSSATFRVGPNFNRRPYSDFYSPALSRDAIRPGTPIYDINGHVVIVFKVTDDGFVHYMDSHPDYSLTRSVFGAQFGRNTPDLGAGFKAWRPYQLVGAQLRNGVYHGGHIEMASDEEIPGFSTEQYYGNVPDPGGVWSKGKFVRDGVELGFYEYMRAVMANGELTYNPLYELSVGMRSLCSDLKDRGTFVDLAIEARIHLKDQPGRLPPNIYGTDQMEWEVYSTPSRDARLKTRFVELRNNIAHIAEMWQKRDKRVSYDKLFLKDDLQRVFSEESAACKIVYINTNGRAVTLTFEDIMRRLWKLSFDPYHCIERRWGATSEAELESCDDGGVKRRWYEAEQRLRNQIERTYERRMDFTVSQLEDAKPGSGADTTPDVDLKAVIERIGPRVAFEGMKPLGE